MGGTKGLCDESRDFFDASMILPNVKYKGGEGYCAVVRNQITVTVTGGGKEAGKAIYLQNLGRLSIGREKVDRGVWREGEEQCAGELRELVSGLEGSQKAMGRGRRSQDDFGVRTNLWGKTS